MSDPLPYAAPVFLVALVVEGVWARYSPRALASSIGCAAVDQIVAGWGLALFVSAFAAVHAAIAPVELAPGRALTWIVAVLGHDVAYYAYHRASHRVTVLWAAHVVHHQSERYDFTVSLRQGAAATWITYAFYLPLALVIDAPVFLAVHAAYQVFQFFVHTRAVRSLGPLEAILATPSHHRVHHGSERRHLDRNYGGFFIVFDRWLGTFAREDREPRYGVPGGFERASPLYANTYLFARLVAASRGLRGRALVRLWLGPPEGNAQLASSAAHVAGAVEPTLARTWLPLAAGVAGAVAIMAGWAGAWIGIASLLAIEIATSGLDRSGSA
ncbi:MAG TPA: sterol desaturase family protein [Kofleriaceae bacterium]|nr:sterol desaturase family protein [Kofleriaceae bacterium]